MAYSWGFCAGLGADAALPCLRPPNLPMKKPRALWRRRGFLGGFHAVKRVSYPQEIPFFVALCAVFTGAAGGLPILRSNFCKQVFANGQITGRAAIGCAGAWARRYRRLRRRRLLAAGRAGFARRWWGRRQAAAAGVSAAGAFARWCRGGFRWRFRWRFRRGMGGGGACARALRG